MKRTLSRRRGEYKKKKSMRRRRIIGGEGPLEKAVNYLKTRGIGGQNPTNTDVINSALQMDSTGDSEIQQNVKIIKDLANPYYNVKNMTNMPLDHYGIAQVMANYIESKKYRSLDHRVSKWWNKESDFKPYMDDNYQAGVEYTSRSLSESTEDTNPYDLLSR
jgi:hypothetical protein